MSAIDIDGRSIPLDVLRDAKAVIDSIYLVSEGVLPISDLKLDTLSKKIINSRLVMQALKTSVDDALKVAS